MAGLNDYSSTAADNATKGDVNFAEGQAPSTVNDSARALMADLAKQRDDISGAVETTGAAGVYAMTPNATAANQITGLMVRVQINHDSPSGGCTFNYGAKGAKAIKIIDSAGERNPNANELKQNAFCTMTYDADAASSSGAWIATDIVTAALDTSNFALKTEGEGTKASAATCDIGSVPEYRVKVTGTTTITSFGAGTNKRKLLRFTDALTLTHNATSLILPGAADLVTAAGDVAEFVSDASGNWRCTNYERASGKALVVDDIVIVGTVSQSGGVPTGAIIERGSNANGTFVRFADGTQICEGSVTPASNNNGGTNATFPAAFAAAPGVAANAVSIASGGLGSSCVTEVGVPSETAVLLKVTLHTASSILDATGIEIKYLAVGRWF
jgi:hypothetical protein